MKNLSDKGSTQISLYRKEKIIYFKDIDIHNPLSMLRGGALVLQHGIGMHTNLGRLQTILYYWG